MENFPCKVPIVDILDLVSQVASITAAQLHHCSVKVALHSTSMSVWLSVPFELDQNTFKDGISSWSQCSIRIMRLCQLSVMFYHWFLLKFQAAIG